MIDLKNIDVTFHSDQRVVKAVRDVSIHVNKGEIYGIVGYSGAGKSTLVRTINLLQRPTKGTVQVKGQDMLALSPDQLRTARKKIGMIFQHFNLMDSRTIFENVAFPLKGSKLSRQERADKVAALLDLVGLGDKSGNYPSQLSGGQKQRVAIARALANDPDILLCDEATSALDPKTTSSILELLGDLNKKLNLTIVIITHEMSVVKDLCDRVAVMEDGHLLEEGSIVDIFTQPKQALTKEFINTATHLDQEVALVLGHESTNRLRKEGRLVRLSYVGEGTTQPFIARMMRDFQVEVNILFGHVEILQEVPVGNLLVGITGDDQAINQALAFLEENQVHIESIESLIEAQAQKKEDKF